MNELQPRIVIFDWDGTLMDSTGHIVASVQAAVRELGWVEPDAEAVRSVIGLSLDRALETVMPEPSPTAVQAFQQAYRRYYLDPGVHEGDLFPGVDSLLEDLAGAGIWAAVATGKGRAGLDRVMGKLAVSGHFVTSRCADEARSKPHPQMLEDILDYTGLEPADALMVGDTTFDLDMARSLRMPAIGVTGGAHPAERLRQSQPLALLDRVADLRSCLSALKVDAD
ncbi:HAD-IA family hydrolase [Natronospira bacteriovora]|uniref:HAD-IA family hydrolase n=1 Tax=Natronospira bacteriovora TaxID=3069753 RepID=A0ABU0W9U2_9GAMM|nr:HAD-IA family hydrolase [Natronospira sp. AB-CW4]MDQ2070727.1 HAD-IA family hydrolase [Natronospira sp. AB-CW4]